MQSIILASTFAVSHNVPETKPQEDNACRENLYHPIGERDWGVQQILTSANWGGVVGNFMTGGLNLQVSSPGTAIVLVHGIWIVCSVLYHSLRSVEGCHIWDVTGISPTGRNLAWNTVPVFL